MELHLTDLHSIKNITKSKIIVITLENIIYQKNIKYKIPKEIPVVFHNGSTYDYHFIIKELAEEFYRQFQCLGENTEKYITFSLPTKKELDDSKPITYKIKLIDNFRFMSCSLSTLYQLYRILIVKNVIVSVNILDLKINTCYENVFITLHGLKQIVKN